MNKSIVAGAFALGALAVAWVLGIFIGSNLLALAITLVIAAVYLLGFMELRQYRRATAGLTAALEQLSQPQPALEPWLQQLHPGLRHSVQSRIEGERTPLPSPVLTPYLVGLLVMLGLLGTFLGMVNTLQGSVAALQGATDLEAMRAGLAAPIQGLSLAFGTSVAGVAASAMLGLGLTLSRRERQQQVQILDRHIAGSLREYSLAHNRQQTYQALQTQATALPELVQALATTGDALNRMGEQLSANLSANQAAFQEEVEHRFNALASAVEHSLKNSIDEGGRRTAESIEPVVKAAMETITDRISNSTQATHQQLLDNSRQQLDAVSEQLSKTTDSWLQQAAREDRERLEQLHSFLQESRSEADQQQAALLGQFRDELHSTGTQQQALTSSLLAEIEKLLRSSDELIEARKTSEERWLQQQQEKMDGLTQSLQTGLTELTAEETRRGEAAVARLETLETSVTEHLTRLGTELEAPMTRLIETASEAPKAAAEVISQLRQEISNNVERDNQLLAERQTLMEQLNQLASTLEQSSGNYNRVLEQLVERATTTLHEVSAEFKQQVETESGRLGEVAASFAGGASEMASLGDAFGTAVLQFSETGAQLIDTLSHIEQSLEQAGTRSDEQLGYYVAQAREVIDHSVLTQKQMLEELRQFGQQEQLFAEVAEGEA